VRPARVDARVQSKLPGISVLLEDPSIPWTCYGILPPLVCSSEFAKDVPALTPRVQ
jgi:hypothetical protein